MATIRGAAIRKLLARLPPISYTRNIKCKSRHRKLPIFIRFSKKNATSWKIKFVTQLIENRIEQKYEQITNIIDREDSSRIFPELYLEILFLFDIHLYFVPAMKYLCK